MSGVESVWSPYDYNKRFPLSLFLYLSASHSTSLPLFSSALFLQERRQRPGRKRPKESSLWHWARVSAGNTLACVSSTLIRWLSQEPFSVAKECARAIIVAADEFSGRASASARRKIASTLARLARSCFPGAPSDRKELPNLAGTASPAERD